MTDASRVIAVSVGHGVGTPRIFLSVEQADAADVASFLASVAELLAQELAARDGKSFDHPLAGGLGPLPAKAACDLRGAWTAKELT